VCAKTWQFNIYILDYQFNLSLLDLLFIGFVRKDMTKAVALEDLTGVKPYFFSNQHSTIIYDLKKLNGLSISILIHVHLI
jgi:hypothetical protein